MQSAFRGFLLTSDTNFLSNYDEGSENVPDLYNQQKQLVDNDTQIALLDSIYLLHNQWRQYADSLIEAKKRDIAVPANPTYKFLFETQLKKMVGKKINDDISAKFLVFDRTEYRLRSTHSGNLINSIRRTQTFSFIFLTLTIVIGVGSTFYILRLISKRIRTMVSLAENISRGDFTTLNDTKNDELTRLSTALNIMSGKLSKN
jgi:methyl-accepting chemotaxis protein